MSTIFITGITGQDGRFMAELLLAEGDTVVGITRSAARAASVLGPLAQRVALGEWDLCDRRKLESLIDRHKPAQIYNFAALSSGVGMSDDPPAQMRVNGEAVAAMLEAMRKCDPSVRFCQASSGEIFGNPASSPQNEDTPLNPRNPYGAAKAYAHRAVRDARARGLFACSAILFNHESPLRPPVFVSRKVARAAAAIKLGLEKELVLVDLDARRDWGFAGDYVRAMRLMLGAEKADDYVVATGVSHAVRDLCEVAFRHAGLNYEDHVRSDPSFMRPREAVPLLGDAAKLRARFGWKPSIGFAQLIRLMVDAELKDLAR